MFVTLRTFTLPPDRIGARETVMGALRAASARLPDIAETWTAPIYPSATINAGHIVWRMVHASEAAAHAVTLNPAWRNLVLPAIADLEMTAVGYRMSRKSGGKAGTRIWRALLFSCLPHSDPALVRALEAKTLLLPKYVPEIRNWALNHAAWSEGRKRIEYIWEQEYDSVEALTGPYMDTPVHWGLVDAYFDADCPEFIVDPHLVQIVVGVDGPVIR